MKKSTIALIEFGMISGVIISAVVLPDSMPLRAFLAGTGVYLLIGNYLLFKMHKALKTNTDPAKVPALTREFRIFSIFSIFWLIGTALFNLGHHK